MDLGRRTDRRTLGPLRLVEPPGELEGGREAQSYRSRQIHVLAELVRAAVREFGEDAGAHGDVGELAGNERDEFRRVEVSDVGAARSPPETWSVCTLSPRRFDRVRVHAPETPPDAIGHLAFLHRRKRPRTRRVGFQS